MLKFSQFQEHLENLESSFFLSLSEAAKEENFYRDIALQTDQSISLIKKEVFLNDLKIGNFIFGTNREWVKENKATLETLKSLLKYWQTLNQLISESIPLISPWLSEAIKQYVQAFIRSVNELDEYRTFKDCLSYLINHSFSELKQEEELLKQYFISEEMLLNCYQITNSIDNQKEVEQYTWQNYNDNEEVKLLAQFITLFKDDLEKELESIEEGNTKEFLKRLLSATKTNDLIDSNQETQADCLNEDNILSTTPQQNSYEAEELIKRREQFKPPFPPKDDRTPEEIEEQIRKNQKGIEHFRKKLTERSPKTPEEIEQGKEDLEFLQEIIRKYR